MIGIATFATLRTVGDGSGPRRITSPTTTISNHPQRVNARRQLATSSRFTAPPSPDPVVLQVDATAVAVAVGWTIDCVRPDGLHMPSRGLDGAAARSRPASSRTTARRHSAAVLRNSRGWVEMHETPPELLLCSARRGFTSVGLTGFEPATPWLCSQCAKR